MLHAVLLCVLVAAPPAGKPRLVVLDMTAQAGMDKEVASSLTDAVTAEIGARGFFQVTSSKEVATLLGVQRQRQLLGCSDEGACQTELAGAIGARYVLSGQVGRVGDSFQLTLQTLDTEKAVPVGRAIRLAKDITTLREQLPYAVADATGTPQPAPPSRLLPYSLIAAGSGLVVAGGAVGISALAQESQINTELASGGPYKSLQYYYKQQDQYGVQRTLSLVGLTAGAALIAAGLYVNPTGGGHAIALVTPSGASIGWAGAFP